MKTKIFDQRLIKFAKHLAKIKTHPRMGEYSYAVFCAIEHGKEIQFATCFHAWIFEDLPLLFNESWYFNDKLKEPFLIGLDEEEGSIAGVFDFFNLGPHEFAHLFDLEGLQQPYYYGGTFLNENATCEHISKNIFRFIEHKEALLRFDPKLN
ncbi:hypothetical protein [Aurantibacillus circumpalustris]|uniref:hypothetical protein n=1 Tax=Aurantibacillus circumpalustris TaxID=3036359 RepID=UPI00295C3A50|nr:hypothetical protein [Aurantibacillus circumpalustris]